MDSTVFKDFQFNVGWKASSQVTLFGKNIPVVVKVKAYFEEDGVTADQEQAYLNYSKDKKLVWNNIERLLIDYDPMAADRFTPTMLLFDRDGAYALLCDDDQEPDNGIAVCLAPSQSIVPQDDYL